MPERKCSGLTTGEDMDAAGPQTTSRDPPTRRLDAVSAVAWCATHRETTRRAESSWSKWEHPRSSAVLVTSFSYSESMIQRVNYSNKGANRIQRRFLGGCVREEVGKTVRRSFSGKERTSPVVGRRSLKETAWRSFDVEVSVP